MLNHERRCPDDRASLDYLETKESSLSVVQQAAWNAKKHMPRGMAYEGDADWEVLMQGQDFFWQSSGCR